MKNGHLHRMALFVAVAIMCAAQTRGALPAGAAPAQTPAAGEERYNGLMREGRSLLEQKKPAEALAKFTEAATLFPGRPRPLLRTSECLAGMNRLPEAESAALKALELDQGPESRKAIFDLVDRRLKDRQHTEALALLAPLYRRFPTDPTVLYWLLRRHNEARQFDAAIRVGEPGLEAYLKENAGARKDKAAAPHFVSLLADAYFEKGALSDAIKQRDAPGKAETMTPAELEVVRALYSAQANHLLDANKAKEAIPFFRRAVELTTDSVWLQGRLGQAMRQGGDRDGAIAYLNQCLSKGLPKDVPIRSQLGDCLFDAERYAEAEAIYRGLATSPEDGERYWDHVVNCLTRQGKHKEAGEEVEAAIGRIEASKRPADEERSAIFELEDRRMDVLDRAGLIDSRISELRKRVAASPKDAILHRRLGDFYLYHGQGTLALGEHLWAAKLGERPTLLLDNARQLFRLGRQPESIGYQEAFIENFPNLPEVFSALQERTRWKSGRMDWGSARFHFPQMEDDYRFAISVCERVLNGSASPEVKARAELERLRGLDFVLPDTQEKHDRLRRDGLELLRREKLPQDVRKEAEAFLAADEEEWLTLAQSNWRQAQSLATANASRERLINLAKAATRLLDVTATTPPLKIVSEARAGKEPLALPEPDLLSQYVETHREDRDASSCLAIWQERLKTEKGREKP